MHAWETGKEIIWGSEKGREENSTESVKLNMEKARRWRIEELWESSPQPTTHYMLLRMFHSLRPLSNSAFSSTEIGLSVSLSLFILASVHCSCNFLPLSCYQSNLKGFLLFLLFFHTVVLRVSVKITENQRGNKYFPLLSLSHCHCIFHFHFTYSVNKELCQALRLRKEGKWLQWSLGAESLKRDMHRIAMKCPIVTISSIHQKSRRRWTGQGQGISKLFTEKELISWKSNQNKQKSPQSHQQQQNKSECTKCLRSSSLEVEFETRIWFVGFIRGVRFKENLSQRVKSKREQGKELSKRVVSDKVLTT